MSHSPIQNLRRFRSTAIPAALAVVAAAAWLVPGGTAQGAATPHVTTSNPTCSSVGASMACVHAWSNGITIDYTGVAGTSPPEPEQRVVLNQAGSITSVQRSFNCSGGTYSVLVPLVAGEWAGTSTLVTSGAAGSPDNNFSFDLVVGGPGSTLAPPTTCEPSTIGLPSGPATFQPPVVAIQSSPDGLGYWLACANGTVVGTENAVSYSASPIAHLNSPIVGMASTVDGSGYWLVGGDGGIFSYGTAQFYGSAGGISLNQPIVGLARTPDDKGYWLVAADGGIFSYGDASFFGSMGGLHLNKPIVGMTSTPDGGGYYLVASDGGIFAFGDAQFQGSMGAQSLNRPIVGMSLDPATGGYWEVAVDGGIFSFNAPFLGSKGDVPGTQPIVGMSPSPSGLGYLLAGMGDAQGGVSAGVYGYGNSAG